MDVRCFSDFISRAFNDNIIRNVIVRRYNAVRIRPRRPDSVLYVFWSAPTLGWTSRRPYVLWEPWKNNDAYRVFLGRGEENA